MTNLIFHGHDSFECRHFWLKKGFDHIVNKGKFNDEAVIPLGVGRNMVNAIRHWMKAYGLLDIETENLTAFGKSIFDAKGFDPYLEDEASLWLLHYQIVTTEFASIYNIIFNDIRKQKPEFTKEHLFQFIKTKQANVNEATLGKDFDAFAKTYIPKDNDTEENYDGLLSDLNLVTEIKKDKKSAYVIKTEDRERIPEEVILYCILQKHKTKSIDFDTLYSDKNSVGAVFAMTKQGLANKLEAIADKFKKEGVVFSDNAGVRELQFKKPFATTEEILKHYYEQVYAG